MKSAFPESAPRHALVLAAGRGTRMRDFGRLVPKPLTPLWNRPMLRRTLETLREWKVTRVIVNLHSGADRIFRELRDRPVPGLELSFSFEPVLLGTGGALRRAAWFLQDHPFWIVNSDIAFDVNPRPLMAALRPPDTLAALWMLPDAGPRTVDVEDGRVIGFRSARPGTPGTMTFSGLQIARPELFRFVPDIEQPCSLVDLYEAGMATGNRIAAVRVPGSTWADLGTPARLLAAHEDTARTPPAVATVRALRRQGLHIRRWAAVDASARVARGAVLEGSVVCAGARVGPRARILDALVGPGTIVRGVVRGVALPFAHIATPAERRAAEANGFRVDAATASGFDARGSAREFIRVEDGRRRAMLIRFRTDRAENARYAAHTRFLGRRLGACAPRLLHEDRTEPFLLMEDLGERSVQTEWPTMSEAARLRLYRRILRDTARFHAASGAFRHRPEALEPPFDLSLYASERRLFLDRFVVDRLGRPDAAPGIGEELERASERLSREPLALVHRDLQSSNLLLTARGPVFIDFQGMRLGPAAYDWASLLYDPYIPMPRAFRHRLIGDIELPRNGRREALTDAAIQRLTQALGAYARLAGGANGAFFVAAIPRALDHLRLALEESDLPFPRFQAFLRDIRPETARR